MEQFLRVNITGDSSKLQKSLKGASASLKTFGSKLTSIGQNLSLRVTAPLALAGGAAIKMASDFQESLNKVDVAFKDSSKEVKDFAKTTLREFGIARGTALDMAALFGDMSTSMGLTTSEASKMSRSLVGLAGDLASFKNMNIEEVTTALAGVFTGETESLKRLGIVMTQVNLENFALQQGINKSIKEMTQAEKVTLRYQFIMSKTANAQGDFARTSGGAANQMRIFQESMKELGANIGNIMLPLFTDFVKKANSIVSVFMGMSQESKIFALQIAGVAAAIPILAMAIGGLSTVMAAIISPIGLVVVALGGLLYFFDDIANAVVLLKNAFVTKLLKTLVRVESFFKKYIFLPIKTASKMFSEFASKQFGGDFSKILEDSLAEGEQISKETGKKLSDLTVDMWKKNARERFEDTIPKVFNALKSKIPTMGLGAVSTDSGAAQTTPSQATEAFDPNSVEFIEIGAEDALLEDMAALDKFIEKTKSLKDRMVELGQTVGSQVASGFQVLGQEMVKSMGLGEGAVGQFASAFLLTAIDMVAASLSTAVAAAVAAGGLGAATFGPAAPIVLPALIAGAVAAVKTAFSASVPALANGGIVSAPTLAMVGDNLGANRGNPEVISPLNKLKGMMASSDRNINVGGKFRLEGQDLVVALQRADRNRSRLI